MAREVVIHDHVPAGTKLIKANPEPSRQSADGVIAWDIGNVAPGEEKTINMTLMPMKAGEIGSVAHVHVCRPGVGTYRLYGTEIDD